MTRHEKPATGVEALLPPLDDQPGPAEPMSPSAQAALIEAALATATPPTPWPRRAFLLGGTAVMIAGATVYLLGRRRSLPPGPRPTAVPKVDAVPPPTAAPSVVPASAATKDPVAAEAPQPPPAPPPPEEKAAPSRKKASSPREVADLLLLANERRRQQRFPEALGLYQQIYIGHPRSEEAYVAEVAAGSLLGDRLHNPQAALRLFRRALRERPAGSLSEEARLGICEAQRALGDPAGEKAALRELLSRHPDSPARARMAARLAQLEGR